ncbi:MAG: polysaccharide biosynthesis tyrosine autokinase [Bacteroidales bacterium]|nr:polysaccharide biosynthesis tyrosine autokinase [Bacteroidales bacterium]
MADNKEITEKVKKASVQNASVPLTDIFFMTLRHWPWIILSVFICVGVAYIHLLKTPYVYTRAAEIQIKEEGNGQNAIATEQFSSLGIFQSNSNIPDEIINLKSKDLMEEVVRRLDLDINYYKDGSFHDIVLYGFDQPVKVSLPEFEENGALSFNLDISNNGEVNINDLNVIHNGKKTSLPDVKGRLNDSIPSAVGPIVVAPTSVYTPEKKVSLIIKKIPIKAARNSYNARLGVALTNTDASIIKLSMSDQSTQRADDVLNTLIAVYNENWINDKNRIAVSTSNFINERLAVIENELGNVDSDISSYKSANLIPDVGAAASMYMGQNQETQARILDLNTQIMLARFMRSYLTADDKNDQLLPANSGIGSGSVQSLISEYNTKVLERNSLVSKSSEKNPLVAQLDEQLHAQRQLIVQTVDTEIASLNAQLKSLQGTEAEIKSRIASNPNQAKTLLSVERQQKVKESLYLFLLQKREENELSQAFTAYNTRIVNKPGASSVPTTPNRRKILGFAFLIGLAIPFGFTFVRETLNTKVRGRKDVEHLSLPFLGEIPQYKAPQKSEPTDTKKLLVKSGKRDIINEAFRVLRTNVEFMCNSSEEASVITLTSFNPGSGKSFISVNLGMSIALKGKKVLIIDGDMRHGSTSSYFGSPKLGLSDYLSGADVKLKDIIVEDSACKDLYVLPIGSVPPNPTELLESKKFAEMIAELKPEFDFIIIDCPPIEVVADAQIIDKYADRTFFIVRAGLLERSMLSELDRLYDSKKFNNMAFILNGTRNDQGRYGYSHSYRYGYGYGYGYGYNYGSDGKKRKK